MYDSTSDSFANNFSGGVPTTSRSPTGTTAEEIRLIDDKSARWIAADTIRELTGETIQKRLAKTK
ncbi:MAG: hypothetical protein IIB13_04285 [Chloroflexi bacterium]|nr:hypothetical protein [Chloroflexota bacterium]